MVTEPWNKRGHPFILRMFCLHHTTTAAADFNPISLSTPQVERDDVIEIGCILFYVIRAGLIVMLRDDSAAGWGSNTHTEKTVRCKVKFIRFSRETVWVFD